MLITAPVRTALSTPLCSTRCVLPFGRRFAHLPVLVAERSLPLGNVLVAPSQFPGLGTRPWSAESWTTGVHSRVTRSEKSPRRRHSSALPGD
ncbi:hypothetical protein AAHC03_012852 [Spirometra sp. Aus1]